MSQILLKIIHLDVSMTPFITLQDKTLSQNYNRKAQDIYIFLTEYTNFGLECGHDVRVKDRPFNLSGQHKPA